MYALVPDKIEETYKIFFLESIRRFDSSLAPLTITTDYEKAIIKAVKQEFQNTKQRKCFFHFPQCIMRAIQAQGFKRRYEIETDFALPFLIISSLAFIPPHKLVKAIDVLCESDIFPPEAQQVIDYFEDTWIGRSDRRQRRRPPQFSQEIWSIHDTILEELSKTNNNVEGWHRGFEEQLTTFYANIWKIKTLSEDKIEQNVVGQEPPRKRRKYRDNAKRTRIVLKYELDQCVNFCKRHSS